MSSFEQTVLEAEERFFATFPAAKYAAEDMHNFFGGPYFQYDAGPGYTAVGETPQSRAHSLSIANPTSSLHYDYPSLPEDVAWRNVRPLDFGANIQNNDPPISPGQHYTPMGIVSYSVPSTSSAQRVIPSQQPSATYFPQQQISHKYEQYSAFEPTHPISTPITVIQSPIDPPNGLAFLPPDPPSDVATSPRSNFQEIRTAILNQDTHAVNRPRVQSPMTGDDQEIMNQDEIVANHVSSPGPSRTSHRHARSFSQHLPWIGPHAGAARPSMRLSPLPTKRQLEKKPPLACLFCRGRKIACGPPLPGSTDTTCNQCQRRSLRCEYPSESRRGMRKKKATDSVDCIDKGHGATLLSSAEITTPDIP